MKWFLQRLGTSHPFSLRSLELVLCVVLLLTGSLVSGISLWKLCALSEVDHAAIVAEGFADSRLPTEPERGFWLEFAAPEPFVPAVWVEQPGPQASFFVLASYVRAISPLLLGATAPIWDSNVDPDFMDPTFLWSGGLGGHPSWVWAVVAAGAIVLIWVGGWRVALSLLKFLVRQLTRRL